MTRTAWLAALLGATGALQVVSACSSSTSGAGTGVADDAGAGDDDASAGDDAAASDAGADTAEPGDFTACDGDCKTTTLAAMFKGSTFPFDRAQFGVASSDAGPPKLRVEVYSGGSPECPGPSSPTPDRTLVLANLPIPTDTTPASSGVNASLFDFKGNMLDSLVVKATTVTATPRAAAPLSGSPRFVSYTLSAQFPDGGTLSGGLYALHCDSLDE